MTQRFIDAVKKCVYDGVLTTEEKELLKKIAKEEEISETDAEIFIIAELKKKRKEQSENSTPKSKSNTDWQSIIKTTGEVIVAVGGFTLTVLTAMGKIGQKNPDKKA